MKVLGRNARKIPEIGIGTWEYSGGPVALRAGLEAGAWLVDTAESYGTEPVIAEAIHGVREKVFLMTKVSPSNFRRDDLFRAADQSLRRLHTDYLDLYQLHHPNQKIPLEETLTAMEALVDVGKVRFIGVSNFSVSQLQIAQRVLRKHPIVSNQVRYNLADRTIEDQLLPYCRTNAITVIAYSPLCKSVDRILDCDERGVLRDIAQANNKTVAQVALNWCLCRDRVVAIPKSNSVGHILENCGASDWRLPAEHVRRLDTELAFCRRGRFQMFLRRCLPSVLAEPLKRVLFSLPPKWRRRFN